MVEIEKRCMIKEIEGQAKFEKKKEKKKKPTFANTDIKGLSKKSIKFPFHFP